MRQLPSIPFTQEGYDKVKSEYQRLQTERPEAVDNLRKAREMGDLSENGYYKASRAILSQLDSRLRHCKKLIILGKVITATQHDTVQIGSQVTVYDGKKERVFSIVGGYESDPIAGKISHHSPIGKSLIGKRLGDSATITVPAGIVVYTIRKIA